MIICATVEIKGEVTLDVTHPEDIHRVRDKIFTKFSFEMPHFATRIVKCDEIPQVVDE